MVPLVALQRSVYVSILRKELSRLLALASGTSNVQSLQNVVSHLDGIFMILNLFLKVNFLDSQWTSVFAALCFVTFDFDNCLVMLLC